MTDQPDDQTPALTDKLTMTEYIRIHGIRARVTKDLGVTKDSGGWEHHAYRVQLTHGWNGAKTTVPWMQGVGVTTNPADTPELILDSLVMDAHAHQEAPNWESFAADFGYPTETAQERRKAASIYNACGKIHVALLVFLGGQAELDALTFNVEAM